MCRYIFITLLCTLLVLHRPIDAQASEFDTGFIDQIVEQFADIGDAIFGDVNVDSSDIDDIVSFGDEAYKSLADEPSPNQAVGYISKCHTATKQFKVSQAAYSQCLEAAKKGDNIAQFYVGAYLYKENPKESIEWLSKAANGNVLPAHDLLGNIYAVGKGTKQDIRKAFQHYLKVAHKLPNTEKKLELFYQEQRTKYENNNKKLLKYIYSVAYVGYAKAQYELGLTYLKGKFPFNENKSKVVKVNTIKAYKWLYIATNNVLSKDAYKQEYLKLQKLLSSDQRQQAEKEIKLYQEARQKKE